MRWRFSKPSIYRKDDGKAAVDTGAFGSMAEGLLVEAHESDLSVASDVTQARVMEVLKAGAETYEGELEMDYLSRLSPVR